MSYGRNFGPFKITRYYGIKPLLFSPLLTEDVLPVLFFIGHMLEPTPTTDTMIHFACILHGRNYWQEGRMVEKLGLEGLSVKEIREMW